MVSLSSYAFFSLVLARVRACMMQAMGDESSTAQVHPQKLSQALMQAAQQKGAQLRIGEVQNVTTSGKKVTGKLYLLCAHHTAARYHVLPSLNSPYPYPLPEHAPVNMLWHTMEIYIMRLLSLSGIQQ